MLIEFYPNPTKKKDNWWKKELTPNLPSTTVVPSGVTGSYSEYQQQQAKAKGIEVAEWARRDSIVIEQAAHAEYNKGDIVYPAMLSKFAEYGACRVIGICSSYADMHDRDWPENDLPMVTLASPLRAGLHPINATARFFKRTMPTK